MYKSSMKVISLILTLVFCIISLAGCGQSGAASDADMEKELDKLGQLNEVTLHFLLKGERKKDTDEVLDEVAERSKLNIKLNFEWYLFDYEKQLRLMLNSNVPLDGFYVGRQDDTFQINYVTMAKDGELKDITTLLPEYAPKIYSKLTSEDLSAIKINGKVYTVPSLFPQILSQIAGINYNFMQKYNIQPIHTFADYEKYLKTIKENEKDYMPGSISIFDTELFARAYDYIILDTSQNLVYKRDDPTMKIVPWEQTPEFREIVSLIARWHKNGYLRKDSDGPDVDIASFMGRASYFIEGKDKLYTNNKTYDIYSSPLYPDKPYQRLNQIGNIFSSAAITFSSKSNNVERSLMFLDWIQSSQENYDLFMYGVEGKHYNLVGERIKLANADVKSYDSYLYWLNSPFKNVDFERTGAVSTNPDGFYKQYSEFIKTKTKYAPHEGFVINYKDIKRESMQRSDIFYRQIYYPLTDGTFKEEDIDKIIQKLKDAGVDRIVYEVQKQLDDWIALNK